MFRWTVLLNGVSKIFHYPAVAVQHKVYAFGSYYSANTARFDVRVFNTVSLRWSHLTPMSTECHRAGHTAALIEHIVYIWGGVYGDSSEYYNALDAFDVDTHTWFKPTVSGTVPERKIWHSACVLGKVMYIYGGRVFKTNNATNDIYKLDTTSMVWSFINTRGAPPLAVLSHSATIIGTKMFVVLGYYYDHIRVFDTETNCWLSSPSAQLPEGRWCYSAFTYNGELYIFGALKMGQYCIELWKFNAETVSWKTVELKGKGPGPMDSVCCCAVGDCIIVFGYKYNTTNLYVLDCNPSLKTLCKLAVIQYGLEQSELPHDIKWELAAMTNNSNRNKSVQ